MKDVKVVENYIERKKQVKVKYYTGEEVEQRLKELRTKNV
ncbi:MAG: hypothetical protein MRERC_3c009 [Mycoplasmataceae bacterium RC_NB112A]|nr:MAG: hypothetical protein MRERC_9c079 [Mycoplasmataceae bacterium RC_NB112A]KLL02188.1 MAG: hypothetical protein MRERC_3c009 [Mycoplasmataceae bacterium RC_NB112A]